MVITTFAWSPPVGRMTSHFGQVMRASDESERLSLELGAHMREMFSLACANSVRLEPCVSPRGGSRSAPRSAVYGCCCFSFFFVSL